MTTGLRRIGRTHALAALAALAGICAPAAASANPPDAQSAAGFATLVAAGGQVSVLRLGQAAPLSDSMPLQLDDVVVTQRGRASVRFHSDGTVLRIGPNTRVQINESAKERDITLFFGRLWAHALRWRERPTRFKTSSTIAAIRGTELNVAVGADDDATQVSVLEGRVLTENEAGSLMLEAGQTAVAAKGKAPALALQVRPRDAVRWALYYLPVIHPGPSRSADFGRAVASLAAPAVGEVQDPLLHTYRASLLLGTGEVEAASRELDRALQLAPGDSDALALRAIVAVVADEPERALEVAGRAVAADPKSATAQIAQSYARQARFDLEGARESLEAAVALEPDNPLAWARLAEVRSSLGRHADAGASARKAVELEPNLSRTQTVLGFADLMDVRTRDAAAAFRKAIELDGDDPLPRLGLGLARIRDGALAEGTREIEIAASLDPGQSLARSYLGKAYFEAKRSGLDEREYDLAKQLDPKDPTPWLYASIAAQTANRPVEALRGLEQAIELNDNRAVYRSRLLLDSDLAARSASLGRIYSDLGFQDRALVEGWSSVNTDPANYSAHRLLADSYASLPRHEIARVSELFQSQMLQPLNTTPIQPSLGESSLFLISAQGPGALAFNEFNPLFNRNQLNAQGSFFVGEDATWSGEGIVSGIHKRASFSAGYSGFETDGFRENNGQEDRIASAFGQLELGRSTSLQAEVRHRELDAGDLELRFYEDDYSALQTEKTDRTTARVGLRQDLGPAMTLLGSYMHAQQDVDFALPNPDIGESFSLGADERSDSFEGQFLFRSTSVKLVGGAGYFDVGADEVTTFTLDIPDFGFTSTENLERNTQHTNLYAYSYLALPKGFDLTLGVSGDLFDESGTASQDLAFPGLPSEGALPSEAAVLGNKDQANPKVGLSWTGKSGTTLRGAWFRTLKRTLITDQTLEPTQVAGFNQFFDDPSATESWVYGGALDQKFGSRAFAGFEYSRRELTIPQTLLQDGIDVVVTENDGDESLARAYLFLAPHDRLTLSAEYQYEELERDPALFLPFSTVTTHRLPLAARFFHPSGFGAYLGATWLDQEGQFRRPDQSEYEPGSASFWVLDAAVRYRLPKRYGFLVAGVNNLTDERATYQATDSKNLAIRPGRVAFLRAVLAFP